MASREWLREHRELQYLRAASASRPRRRLSRAALTGRRHYERLRWQKYQALGEGHRGRN
jgi:hypothetical protein